MRSFDKNAFINKVEVRPNNILEGFNNYNNAIITTELITNNEEAEKYFIRFLRDIFEINKNSIVDYYGNTLNDDEFSRMIDTLSKDEKDVLIQIREKSNSDDIYFEIDNISFLDILIKLSVRGILFSTFYIINDKVTIWSNYDYKFVIFFKDKNIIHSYEEIAKKYKLIVKDINNIT